MFSRKFEVNHKRQVTAHHAISFTTTKKKSSIVKLLMEMSVAAFVTPDNVRSVSDYYNNNFKEYNDNRIEGITYHAGNTCCAFTKNSQRWYLFPIHENQLENVGLTGEDLVAWLAYLNDMKAGMEYLYLGVQQNNKTIREAFTINGRYEDEFHWVAVPASPEGTSTKKSYFHWIFLRYLFNTVVSTNGMLPTTVWGDKYVSIFGEKVRWPYYMIPRITMMLHEDYGISKFKALMWAHLANPFKGYYAFLAPDMVTTEDHVNKADLSLTPNEFKILINKEHAVGANVMSSLHANQFPAITELVGRRFTAPYKHFELIKLFDSGNYEGFIKHIKDAYKGVKEKAVKPKTTKENVQKKATSNQ